MKTGIVDVGGGYRGIYAAGVLDYCIDHNIQFDLGIGVSAGSANLISYAAGQARRNFQFFSEYGLRKEYAGAGNFFRKNTFIDMDYVYGTLSNSDGENPLDYPAMISSPMDLLIVATDAESGKPVYFTKEDVRQDDYSVLKASCAIPFVCHPYAVEETLYFDGALGDPVPIKKAFNLGCDRVILLLTRPVDKLRSSTRDAVLARMIQKDFPLAAAQLRQRADRYNHDVALAKQMVAAGKMMIIAPDDTCGVGTLCKDEMKLKKLYAKGYADGKKITAFLN